ncbi:MAG: prepilin-type N-terminal cleavage/methylation domain-containing protein [bacterium]
MNKKKAFTLIEILIVLAIVGMIIGIGIPQVQRVFRTNLKSSAAKLSGLIRFAYDSSVVKGITHRIVFDFDKRSYKLEVSPKGDLISLDNEKAKKDAELKKSLDQDKESEKPPTFYPYEGEAGKEMVLPSGIIFDSIENISIKRKITSEIAYLYFFPQGMTENVIIRLKSEKGEAGYYSIKVNPANARAKIEGRYIEEK